MTTDGAPRSGRQRRNVLKITGIVAAAVVLLVAGVVIGAAANSHSSQLAAERATVASLQHKLRQAIAQQIATQGKLSAAQVQAMMATTKAQNAAAAQYASREAAVQRLLRKLQSEQATVQANTISADGVYVVGRDIKPGTYHTSGGGQCYYALLASDNTSNIIDNNNFNGPETVDVSAAHAFQISGGCVWHLI